MNDTSSGFDPERVPAGYHATMGVYQFAGEGPDGLWDDIGGGWGGSAEQDRFSPLKTMFHGDNRELPVEVVEARFPLRSERAAVIPDPAGRGKHRGGFGVEKIVRTDTDDVLSARPWSGPGPPRAVDGGQPSVSGGIEIQTGGDGAWVSALKVTDRRLPKGSRVRVRALGQRHAQQDHSEGECAGFAPDDEERRHTARHATASRADRRSPACPEATGRFPAGQTVVATTTARRTPDGRRRERPVRWRPVQGGRRRRCRR